MADLVSCSAGLLCATERERFAVGMPVTRMTRICYRRHRFPATIIQHAIWLYGRFTLSYRDIEYLLAERGEISYETIRRWVLTVFWPEPVQHLLL